jgi:hypothetical protein
MLHIAGRQLCTLHFNCTTSTGLEAKFSFRPACYSCSCHACMHACRLQAIGGNLVDLDFGPLCETARMLYGSSFIAERAAGIAAFLSTQGREGSKRTRDWMDSVASDSRLLPVTRAIMGAAGTFGAGLRVPYHTRYCMLYLSHQQILLF